MEFGRLSPLDVNAAQEGEPGDGRRDGSERPFRPGAKRTGGGQRGQPVGMPAGE